MFFSLLHAEVFFIVVVLGSMFGVSFKSIGNKQSTELFLIFYFVLFLVSAVAIGLAFLSFALRDSVWSSMGFFINLFICFLTDCWFSYFALMGSLFR